MASARRPNREPAMSSLNAIPVPPTLTEPAGAGLGEVLDAYRTCEFATVSRRGTPIAWPLVTQRREGGTFVLTTSIGLPQKALNIRRNPAVAMLFSDPTASGLFCAPNVLVQGTARCPDEIVTDVGVLSEYWRRLLIRQPSSSQYSRTAIGRRMMAFYYLRLIMTVTPQALTTRSALPLQVPLIAPPLAWANRSTAFGRAAARLPGFSSAVLAGFDSLQQPTLVRVRPVADAANGVFSFSLSNGVDIAPGPASLLCHSHDEQLTTQRSFVATGTVTGAGAGWTMTPERYIPGADRLGPIAAFTVIRDLQSTARRYLDARGLDTPTIDWAAIEDLRRQVHKSVH